MRTKRDISAILRENPNLDTSKVIRYLRLCTERGHHRGQDLRLKWANFR